MHRLPIRLMRLVALGLVVAVAVALAATTASSGATTTGARATAHVKKQKKGITLARRRVKHAMKPIAWKAPGPAFDMSKNKGKTVYFIATTLALPFVVQIADGFKQAAKAAGINAVVWNGNFSETQQNAGVQEAISRGASGIILQAVDPTLLASSVRQAEAAHIPIVDANNSQPTDPLSSGIFAHVAVSTVKEGKLQVDYSVAKSGKKADVLILNAPVYTVYKERVPAYKKEFKRVCPQCKYKIVNIDLTNPTAIPGQVATLLNSNPKINWVFPVLDGIVPQVEAGIREAHAAHRVRIASTDNVTAQLQTMGKQKLYVEDSGNFTPWQGWAELDMLGRAMLGLPKANGTMPQRLFDSKHAPKHASGNWTGVNYKAKFLKLWGLTK